MTLLTEKQKTELIRNTVDEIMENLDNFYYDELMLKAKQKQLIKFFTENFKLLELWTILDVGTNCQFYWQNGTNLNSTRIKQESQSKQQELP